MHVKTLLFLLVRMASFQAVALAGKLGSWGMCEAGLNKLEIAQALCNAGWHGFSP
jgi:hypothetical protein